MKERKYEMVEIEIDFDEKLADKIVAWALKEIKKDRKALLNYGINKCLEEVLKTDGKCLKLPKRKK